MRFNFTTTMSTQDARFTITREFAGYKKARYILRFCGEWIKSFSNKASAKAGLANAISQRHGEVARECSDILSR